MNDHSNDKRSADSEASGAVHLAFAQTIGPKRKHHRYELPDYTVYNCPKRNNDKGQGKENGGNRQNHNNNDRKKKVKNSAFTQVQQRKNNNKSQNYNSCQMDFV